MKKNLDQTSKILFNITILLILIVTILVSYCYINLKILKKEYPSINGYTYFEVASGSMSPKINKSDIIIVKKKSKYKKNDIISYKQNKSVITHRIVNIDKDKIITKGDANNNIDEQINKKNVIGKVIMTIPKGGTIKKTLRKGNVIITFLITLLIISIAYSYKDTKKKIDKKELKTYNLNTYLKQKINKERIIKWYYNHIEENKLIEILKVDILLIILLTLINTIPITLSRYDSTGIGNASTNIAFYLLKPDYNTTNIKLTTLTPSDTPYVYTFTVSNYDGNKRSEVDLEYTLKLITTTNLPLVYKLYKNEDYTSNNSTNLVTNNNTLVEKDADDTYFKYITLEKEYLYYNTPKQNTYTLLVYYTKASANFKYQNTVESIRVEIDSNQMVNN